MCLNGAIKIVASNSLSWCITAKVSDVFYAFDIFISVYIHVIRIVIQDISEKNRNKFSRFKINR